MKYSTEKYALKARETAAEGIVLLKNDNEALPLVGKQNVAVFGRNQFHYYKSGTGSGGMVNTSYVVSVLDALEQEENITVNPDVKKAYENWNAEHPFDLGQGWAGEPWYQEEMPISDELIEKACAKSDIAMILIGRTAGEDHDNKVEAGSYLLTDAEKVMLEKVCGIFPKTVVLLNVGNVIDMNWVKQYNPSAVAYIWQGGQEGGNAVADILTGRVNPSGKLPDTIVKDVTKIPSTEDFGNPQKAIYKEDIYVGYRYFETFAREQVLYPFGFGLSYTSFIQKRLSFKMVNEKTICIEVEVMNTGDMTGKEVVQVYCAAPQGRLGKPARSLCGFAKTRLLKPGEKEIVTIRIELYGLASYDDSGVTGYKSAYVLEEGNYEFYIGSDVRTAQKTDVMNLKSLCVMEQLSEAMAPEELFQVIKPEYTDNGECVETWKAAANRTVNYDQRVIQNLPKNYEITGDKGYKLKDVADGKVTIEEFVSQFTMENLASIVRGEGMCSPKATPGIAGAFGGVTSRLKEFGIPVAGCADGPSGIRMDCGTMAFAMPNGTLLAATFNETLLQELYEWTGLELRRNKIDTLLGPGMNIHRNPLNGRNFEYFSEDPLLTGKMASAQLKGMQKYNVTGTIKHFACNNQETNRHNVEAVLSERALREIYLKGFEIAVKEAGAYSIMTSYNPINGHWSASNYDLLTIILRGEWKYDGIVMTDWWAKGNFAGENGMLSNTAAKAQAQNDLFMVTLDAGDQSCDNSLEMMNAGKISVGEYQRNAMNICRYLMRTPAFEHMVFGKSELERELEAFVFEGDEKITKSIDWYVNEMDCIAGEQLSCRKDDVNLLTVVVDRRGIYSLSVTCRASANETNLAQIPLTIFKDKDVAGSVTLTGADKEWKTFTFNEITPFYLNSSFLKLRFGQSGMEIKDIKMTLVMDLEEQIKAAMG